MKLTIISDTHGQRLDDLPNGDVLIHCGDDDVSSSTKFYHLSNYLKEYKKSFKQVICIAGNHDFYIKKIGKEKAKELFNEQGIVYLEDESYEFEGVVFYGAPWSVRFGHWAFMREEEELVEIYKDIPEKVDVLITHSPPYSVLDQEVCHKNKCGSMALYHAIKQRSIGVHVFGHIHEGYGNKDNSYNCSVLNEHYKLTNNATRIEI